MINGLLPLTTDPGTGMSTWVILGFYAVLILALYFILIRPQQKRKKKEENMRKSAEVGDEITTIGGISGRIVGIKADSDSVVLETGGDRNRITVKRWAIGSVQTVHDTVE